MGRLDGRVALVTGGTSGIGRATAELFHREGARVVVAGRDARRGEAIAGGLGPGALFVAADVTREDDVAAAVARTVEAFGRIDVLFNNAGGPTRGGIEDVDQEGFREAMDLLVGSVVFGMKHATPRMKAQRFGRIINNASVAGHRTDLGGYLYSAAKAAVAHLTRLAGRQLGAHGITVNAISPGAIATPIFFGGSQQASSLEPDAHAGKLAKLEGNLARATPAGRSGLPADIAAAALYLASDEGGFVNGHDLVVDGGMLAGGKTDYGAPPPGQRADRSAPSARSPQDDAGTAP